MGDQLPDANYRGANLQLHQWAINYKRSIKHNNQQANNHPMGNPFNPQGISFYNSIQVKLNKNIPAEPFYTPY